jgi:hypothetical protein
MNSGHQVALGPLVLLLLTLAPASAFASKAATVARTRDVVYRDRTPRVHDATPKQHHHQNKNQ